MSIALRLALVLITLACLGMFLFHPWWFPAQASAQAPALDRGLKTALWVLGGLFIGAQLVLVFLLGSGRGKSSSRNWYGNWRFEIGWTAAIAAIFFWFSVSGSGLWSRMTSLDEPSGAIRVEVTGVQFQWYFRYPGPDGLFGRVDAQKFARPAEGNPLGIDPSDPAGKDDFVSSTLVVPVGHPVELDLRAQDVIHSVFIPAMRLKQDAVPGMDIRTHFTPTEVGNYELVCSQLCGLGHYRMKASVRVVSEAEFKQWLKDRSANTDQPPDLKTLYDRHQWFQLREATLGMKDQPLYRGAAACAFGELRACEELLQQIIRASPRSSQAHEADEILENAYLRIGRYKKALARAQARLASQPEDEDARNDYALLAVLGQSPDLSVSRRGYSTIPWRTASTGFTAPLTINGRSGTYVFDSGAGISTISESEAKRLGLIVHDSGATAGNIAGGQIAFRTAVADELVIGGFLLKHVAFLVFRDDQLPFGTADSPTDERGLIGLPVMLALGRLRWKSGGSLEVGFPPALEVEKAADSNLFFDGSAPATVAEVQGRRLNFSLDTGAEETRLYPPFADTFAGLIKESGKRESASLTGVGQTAKVDSIVLPVLEIRVGGLATALRPAHVLLKETSHGSLLYYGNLGVDLLRQAHSVTFDFRSMKLTLE